ncbi:MAG: pyridoxamine 5'-phosphate oxidase [Opitutaceae bacterium]|nr:pyridoxamine 5'-phosphate oxidase [Opitutaceae bacterium]
MAGEGTTPPVLSPPLARFCEWMAEARAKETADPTRMALATVDDAGHPRVRMVLLKNADDRGFVFYTNLDSPKARDLAQNPRAELCIHWPVLEKQVRVSGPVSAVTPGEADAYFASRPRLSQLGAWASRQSTPMKGYWEFERAVASAALRYPLGDVPRPPHWSGFRVFPETIEFWHQKPFRHHERTRWTRLGDNWQEEWLYP